jgi:hypothetical protein
MRGAGRVGEERGEERSREREKEGEREREGERGRERERGVWGRGKENDETNVIAPVMLPRSFASCFPTGDYKNFAKGWEAFTFD